MNDSALATFDGVLAKANMRGQWKSEEFLGKAIGGPKPAGAPALWPWKQVSGLLDEAGKAMPESLQARRSLIFANPELPRGTTHTINMGIQMIMPGEVAWAHRHSISALRFIVQGHPQLTTIVDGEPWAMEDFDLVLTPNWTWHAHHNRSDRPTYWVDVLDVPLVLGLNQTFYEPGTGEDQPADLRARHPDAILRYPWKDVAPKLADALVSAHDGKLFDYLDAAGGPTMPTLGCKVQTLPPGFSTASRRRTSSAVYFVMRGEGVTECDGREIRWGRNDCFAIPNWAKHRHVNLSASEEALLFSTHDIPVMTALGFFREELF